MKKLVLTFILLSLLYSPATAQGGETNPGGDIGGGGEAASGDADPIAIAAAHILKGHTNNQQRKYIRTQYLTVAAQKAEDLLRSRAFKKILEFVEKNRDLFADIYDSFRQAKTFVKDGLRVRALLDVQRNLLLEFTRTGQLIQEADNFDDDEIQVLGNLVERVGENVTADFNLLNELFFEKSEAQLTDKERYEILGKIEARAEENLSVMTQFNRYIEYLNASRNNVRPSGIRELLDID